MSLMRKRVYSAVAIIAVLVLLLSGCAGKKQDEDNPFADAKEKSANKLETEYINEGYTSARAKKKSADITENGRFVMPEGCTAMVYVTINPELCIYLDAEGKVLAVEALNDDAKTFVDKIDISKPLEEVVEKIINYAGEGGFIKENADISIEITAPEAFNVPTEDIEQKIYDRIHDIPEIETYHASLVTRVETDADWDAQISAEEKENGGNHRDPEVEDEGSQDADKETRQETEPEAPQLCERCGGSKEVDCEVCGGSGQLHTEESCIGCNGTGHPVVCVHCDGTGQLYDQGKDCPYCEAGTAWVTPGPSSGNPGENDGPDSGVSGGYYDTCNTCGGDGWIRDPGYYVCNFCDGDGANHEEDEICPSCAGTGTSVYDAPCIACDQTGRTACPDCK